MCIVLVGVVCIVVVVCGTCVYVCTFITCRWGGGEQSNGYKKGRRTVVVCGTYVWITCAIGGEGGGGCGRDVCNPGPFDRQQGPIHTRGYGPRFLIPPPHVPLDTARAKRRGIVRRKIVGGSESVAAPV